MAETNKITKLALNEDSYNIGGTGSTDPYIIQLTDPESMNVNFTELKTAIDENRPVYISEDGYTYGIEIIQISDTEIALGFASSSVLMIESDNTVHIYGNRVSTTSTITSINNPAVSIYGIENGVIDILLLSGNYNVSALLFDSSDQKLYYYHGSNIPGTTKLSEVPHFEITEAPDVPDVPSVQTISSSNDLKLNQINADIVKLSNYTVDSVAYTGVASFSSDGTNYTLICGDLYVRGTGDQTVATATTRWKFSDMINKTVLTALYS